MNVTAPLSLPARALVREVPSSYLECLREDRAVAIDLGAARTQHAGYVRALRALGVEVDVVPADEAHPDACFVEDTAVVTGAHALATRPGAASRRGEVAAVARLLQTHCTVHTMDAPAMLDGGDVLRAGDALFVGLSARTNEAGARRLAEIAALDGRTTRMVPVAAGLHLKSACTLAAAGTLLYAPDLLNEAALGPFREAGLACVPVPEREGANVLALGAAVLVSAAAPETATLLERRGLTVVRVEVSEFHKGDGALTCLSIRIPPRGGSTT